MQDIFARAAKFLRHPFGKAGFFLFLSALGTTFAIHPALAADGPQKNTDLIDRIALTLADLALWVAALLAKLVIQIIQVMLPVMTYNNFTNSPIVNAGWSIVRDTVNMFFVIVLIIIAFGTIFGHKKFQWQQQVPHLLIFAIVINFSKTLAGLMIDFGQVIMLTFANALQQIAAGNFVQLLGFTDIYAIGTNNSTYESVANGTGTGVSPFDFFAASIAAVFMMLVILATMLIMLAILVYRVIMLWILIVMAPLAWFVGGAKDIIKSHAYEEWWDRFKCLVAIGPVLTFFLWLTLAVAGAGNIAAKSGFDVSAQGALSNPGGVINKIFELDRFMSFIIAIAMLFAGFEAAQSICKSMPRIGNMKGNVKGAMKQFKRGGQVAGGLALKGGAGAARLGLRGLGAGAGLAGREIGSRIQNKAGLRALTKQGRADALRDFARTRGNGTLGRAAALGAERLAAKQEGALRTKMGEYGKKYEKDSMATKVSQLKRFAEAPPMTVGGKYEAAALMQQVMGDKDAMKLLGENGTDKKLWQQYGKQLESRARGDSEAMDKIATFKKQNPHIAGSANMIKTEDDVKALSDSALLDNGVREALKNIKTETRDDSTGKFMSAYEKMQAGLYQGNRRAFLNAEGGEKETIAFEAMTGQQLLQMSSKTLAGGTDTVFERAMGQAMSNGDTGRLEEVLTQLTEQMKTGTAEQKFTAQTRFDNLTGQVALSTKGQDKGFEARMETMLQKANGRRDDALNLTATRSGGKLVLDHGAIPMGKMTTDPAFAAKAFGNASTARIVDAKNQISDRMDELNKKKQLDIATQANAQKLNPNQLPNTEAVKANMASLAAIDKQIDSLGSALMQLDRIQPRDAQQVAQASQNAARAATASSAMSDTELAQAGDRMARLRLQAQAAKEAVASISSSVSGAVADASSSVAESVKSSGQAAARSAKNAARRAKRSVTNQDLKDSMAQSEDVLDGDNMNS